MPGKARIGDLRAVTYRIPTDGVECDGTLCWDATEVLAVQIPAAGQTGLGYSYTQARPAAAVVRETLADCLRGEDPFDLPRLWQRMNAALRNLGRPGLAMMALAAVDIALWDLKARLSGLSLARLWGRCTRVPQIYGSGGFTNYDDTRLQEQLSLWAQAGLRAVKIKVGRDASDDPRRVHLARETVGQEVALMVDANGAFDRTQALELAGRFADSQVCWFEEPVSSDDLSGLRWLGDRAPAGMAVTAGEYGWDIAYFRRMLESDAVGVLQADATRCGYTGFMQAATLCEAFDRPLSAHCAPALHAVISAAIPLHSLEYFHDHVRVEELLFNGIPELRDGVLQADTARPGHGLEIKPGAAAHEF